MLRLVVIDGYVDPYVSIQGDTALLVSTFNIQHLPPSQREVGGCEAAYIMSFGGPRPQGEFDSILRIEARAFL